MVSTTGSNNGDERVPLREHAIILLDVLIEAIDINDVVKLSLAVQVI